jgi:tyrosinase
MMIMYSRKSVWANGGDFSDPILLWYAKGVAELMQRPLADKTSWRFLAAIHGEDFSQTADPSYWQQYGYYRPGEPLPDKNDQAIFWNQCQHQSWYFLPWHRGYLISLEAIVRQAIINQCGPADWALPYWDYSAADARARDLPPAFKVAQLPDGSVNPLFIAQRYGAQANPATLPLPAADVSLKMLNIMSFVGASSGGNPGFGGPETAFNHDGGASGGVESLPHNIVHVDIGQSDEQGDPGLMSDPNLAGLDPIFYLHHANIDRLWSYWLSLGDGRANPADQSWLQGPVGRPFMMPMPNGESWRYAPKDVLSTAQLGYNYDPLSDGDVVPASEASKRAVNFGFAAMTQTSSLPGHSQPQYAELLGANDSVIHLNQQLHSVIKLDKRMMQRTAKSFSANLSANVKRQEPDRYYLNLESIRGKREGITLDVHLKLDEMEVLIQSLGLFGIKDASRADRAHGGNGLTLVLDVTAQIDQLHLSHGIDNLAEVEVLLTPRNMQNAELSVERISLYRQ